ncbi:N-acetylmuramoyl-L-alanine amidase [Calothrix sp. NIES-3974]|uniref:N-acetylmuramoyl-L-alanine amidase n=1 Tax=Calothrix sp. NIES-3974 TaxID=2005462 RepID=UPI000B60C1D6|nr:N-acetylmuramoyl-L-alanine amidase [Calothrix sp. NIES-3974]BAZ04617.1 cell wall hydrolase/autolysin [Calothrix sp. NIES-3974]
MKIHWLLPGSLIIVPVFMLASPAQAARLQSWRFDPNTNQLEIRTEGAVQPQAQLVFNPTRLVIDLPGINFGRPQTQQTLSGSFRAVRVGQFDPSTARIVVEVAPGYTLDPQQVQFEGRTTSYWIVKLPSPQRQTGNSSNNPETIYGVVNRDRPPSAGNSSNNPTSSTRPIASGVRGATQVDDLRITGDGLFVRTSGTGNPLLRVNRSSDRRTINIDVTNASISPNLGNPEINVNRFGVSQVRFTELESNPPIVRISLNVDRDAPNWQASRSGNNGIILLPDRLGSISNERPSNPSDSTPNPSPREGIATIESIDFNATANQLLIRANKGVRATSGWDRSSAMFQVTIPNAKLAPSVRGPQLDGNSPVLRVRLQELKDSQSVVVLVQPAARVQIGQLNQLSGQLLALELRRDSSPITPPVVLPPLPRPNPAPTPEIPDRPTLPNPTPVPRPTPNSRPVVFIDPGHGGQDPGAIGIGGLREKDVILPISQRIAQVLEQNGIQVVMARNADYFVSLQGRVDMAEQARASVFVSIHANSAGASRPDVNGLETYYYESGLRLAQVVHASILRSVDVPDRKVRKARFYVLRRSSMPSILVETGFVTGAGDAARLRNPVFQRQMGEAIARGILQYLGR